MNWFQKAVCKLIGVPTEPQIVYKDKIVYQDRIVEKKVYPKGVTFEGISVIEGKMGVDE